MLGPWETRSVPQGRCKCVSTVGFRTALSTQAAFGSFQLYVPKCSVIRVREGSHVQILNRWPVPCCISHLLSTKQKKKKTKCCLKENSLYEAENGKPSQLTHCVILGQRDVHSARLLHLSLCSNYIQPALGNPVPRILMRVPVL